MFIQNDFLTELREVRVRKGISVTEMAKKLKTSISGVHFIEGGNPSLKNLAKYLDILELDLNDIFKE